MVYIHHQRHTHIPNSAYEKVIKRIYQVTCLLTRKHSKLPTSAEAAAYIVPLIHNGKTCYINYNLSWDEVYVEDQRM